MSSDILLVLFLICSFSAVSCKDNINEYILKRIEVGKCRASCISKFYLSTGQIQDGNNLECTSTANWKCGMCWDYCDLLIEEEQTRIQMCSDNICMDGCKLACKFYENNQDSKELSTSSSKISDIKLSNRLLSWNHKTGVNSNLKTVFVGFGLKCDGKWEELDQVLEEKITLADENEKLRSVTIFAVSSQGISTYVLKNLTGSLLTLCENINFSVFDKLSNKEGSSFHLKQWTIYVIVFVAFIIFVVICLSFFFLNKMFISFSNKQSVPISISSTLSDNSAYCIDLQQTISHTNRS